MRGTLIRLADAGWEIHIATVANGDCGSVDAYRAKEIAAVRFKEGQAAAAKIGATYHCVAEPDIQVVFDKPTNRKVIELVRRIAPTLLFTHPRHDYMLDHEQVHLLARAAAFSYPIPNASSLPLVAGSAIPWLYYCDPVEGRDPYTGESTTPTTYVDVTATDGPENRDAGLPRVAARLAAFAPRHGRVHRGDETLRRGARTASNRRPVSPEVFRRSTAATPFPAKPIYWPTLFPAELSHGTPHQQSCAGLVGLHDARRRSAGRRGAAHAQGLAANCRAMVSK